MGQPAAPAAARHGHSGPKGEHPGRIPRPAALGRARGMRENTAKGIALWPVVRAMMTWGDTFYSRAGARRALRRDQDGGLLDHEGRCRDCGLVVPVPEIQIEPGPGFDPAVASHDPMSLAINTPRRLLEPITAPLGDRMPDSSAQLSSEKNKHSST